MGIFGVNFCPGFFLACWVLPPFYHPCHLKSRVPSLGAYYTITKETPSRLHSCPDHYLICHRVLNFLSKNFGNNKKLWNLVLVFFCLYLFVWGISRYPAGRGFSLVFLSIVLPFSSLFWLLAFCFGCFCAKEKTSADSRLGFLLSMREMKMRLPWNFCVTCR